MEILESAEQGEIGKGSAAAAFWSIIRDARLMHRWAAYCENPHSHRKSASSAWRAVKSGMNRSRGVRSQRVRIQIEAFVTRKHLILWDHALDHDFDWVVVLEDDVVWDTDRATDSPGVPPVE